MAKIPFGAKGAGTEQVKATSENPAVSDGTGAFRTTCEYSHMAFDDPIVKPGQPGTSHLHVFYGNSLVDGNSTATSIATTGNGTCRGGVLNRSAYWVPAMIDTRDGTPITWYSASFYYKTGYNNIGPANVKPPPAGLRMVAGDSKNTSAKSAIGSFECVNGGENLGSSASILNCPVGASLVYSLYFPQCWDGVNLDSPDHKSHMSYPTSGGKCPSTHPVAIPEISFHIPYVVREANAPLNWRFSSDNYSTSLPGGLSGHGDWFNGWKAATTNQFVAECLQPAKDCHSHLIGRGKEIF